jgi:hypothetical protein
MVKSLLTIRLFIIGFILWIVPFILAIPLFQLMGNNRIVFKSIMGLIIVAVTVLLWDLYLKKINQMYIKHALVASIVWIFISLFLDYFAFIIGFKMPASTYFLEIATSYLAIPMILLGSAKLLDAKKEN